MLIFSAKSRQLIDFAMADYGDSAGREIWNRWVSAHPNTRREGEPWHDGIPELPRELVAATLRALDEMRRRKRNQREMPGLTLDQLSELDDDLSQIKATETFLTQWAAPREQRHPNLR
ncbi:MAG TPA: hypothetical protein VJR47_07005 [Stellaceae bacterium]|nr:hypothetical protein [Stellaceae bacterium]